jgi:hypothetical protein
VRPISGDAPWASAPRMAFSLSRRRNAGSLTRVVWCMFGTAFRVEPRAPDGFDRRGAHFVAVVCERRYTFGMIMSR